MIFQRSNKILLFIILPLFFASAQRKPDSLTKLLNKAGDEGKAELYLKIGKSFENANIDSALYYDSLSLKFSRITLNTSQEAEALYSLGHNYYVHGDNALSLDFTNKALTLYYKIHNRQGIAKTLNYIGIITQTFGDFEGALAAQLKALQNYEDIKDYDGIILTYNHLGVFYKNLNEFSKETDFYNQALKLLEAHPNEKLLARTYNNIANMYWLNGELNNALKYNTKALELKKKIHAGPIDMVNSYLSMGSVLRSLKQYKAAAEQFNMGLKIANKIGNKNHQAILLKNLGVLYSLMKQYNKALAYHKESMGLAREINFNRVILDNLESLSKIYKNLTDYKLSLQYFKKYTQVKDSIFSQELKNKLDEYRNRFELERKAKEIQKLKSDRQNSIFLLMIFASMLIVILSIVIYNRFRTKSQTNIELSQKNMEVAGVLNELNELNKNLTESETTYRYLFERNPMPMLILVDNVFNILAANKSAVKEYGYSEHEFIGLTFKKLWAEENLSKYDGIMLGLVNSPGKIFTVKHRKKTGDLIHAEIVAHHLVFEGKNAIHVMITNETERKLIEQIVIESEERFRTLFEGGPDAIILADPSTGIILDANPAASMLLQRPLSQLIGMNHAKLYPAEKQEEAVRYFNQNIESNIQDDILQPIENVIIRPDGSLLPIEISRKLITIAGKPIVQGIVRDISYRKTTEEALIQNEQRLKRAQKIAFVGNWELDLKTGIVWASEESALIYGYKRDKETIEFNKIKELANPKSRQALDEAMNNLILNGSDFDIEFEIRKKDTDEVRILHTRAELVKDENDQPVKVLGVLRDITDLKIFQEQLILARERAEKSDKLKSEFLAQMSHEIRSPVNIIMSFASLIKEELKDEASEDIKTCFNAIDNGGRRLIRTIDLILNMADVQSGKYEPYLEQTDLEKDILQNLILDFASAANIKGLEILFENKIGKKLILLDRYTATQIFANLIDNAIKYTKQGRVTIRLKHSPEYIEASVADTGIGISEEFMPHLFDPFSQEEQGYTRRFEGTGLGLSLVKKYCDLNGAKILIESKKGKGTVFTIRFPIMTENMMLASYSSM